MKFDTDTVSAIPAVSKISCPCPQFQNFWLRRTGLLVNSCPPNSTEQIGYQGRANTELRCGSNSANRVVHGTERTLHMFEINGILKRVNWQVRKR